MTRTSRTPSGTRPCGGGLLASSTRLRTTLAVLCALWLVSSKSEAPAQPPEPSGEYLLKAAFLYNFAKFVEWPGQSFAGANTPLTLCVMGYDRFGSALDALTAKAVKGRPLDIRRVTHLSDAGACHMLFIDRTELAHTATIVPALRGKPVLTVCDREACAQQGLMINMLTVESQIQLEINLPAVQDTPLTVSAQLLKLARLVKEER